MLGTELWEPPHDEVVEEFFNFSEIHDASFFETMEATLTSRLSATQSRWCDAPEIRDFLIRKIKSQEPASLVRLSDGEGNIIMMSSPFGAGKNLVEWCSRRISYIHFGDHRIINKDPDFFSTATAQAFNNADVIGFAPFTSVIRSFDIENSRKDVRAICGNRASLLYLNEQLGNNRMLVGTSAWVSRDLLPFYKDILLASNRVCTISTYDQLGGKLSKSFGVELSNIDHIPVPVQAVFVPTADRKDTRHYPDAMRKIVNEIRSCQEHTTYLVAAGLLGKHYCEEIRMNGGVAIDIGSIAEVWMGIQARGIASDFINKWKL